MATKRTWTIAENGMIVCYKSDINDCTVIDDKLATVSVLTSAHDEELAVATREINTILDGLLSKKHYDKRHLCLLNTHKGPLLAWTFEGTTSEAGDKDVEAALNLE